MTNELAPKTAAQLKLLVRLLISSEDFHHAARIASYILENELQSKVKGSKGKQQYQTKLLWEALNSAMIIAYCRPFSGNDRRSANKIPDLPLRFLKVLTKREREVHGIAMNNRNTLLAHSDSGAWGMRTGFVEYAPDKLYLLTQHRDVRAPLPSKIVRTLGIAAIKLRNAILAKRMTLEKELTSYIPIVNIVEFLTRDEREG